MDRIDAVIGKQLLEIRITLLDAVVVCGFVELSAVATTHRRDGGIGMSLVDRNELRSKTETHHRDVEL